MNDISKPNNQPATLTDQTLACVGVPAYRWSLLTAAQCAEIRQSIAADVDTKTTISQAKNYTRALTGCFPGQKISDPDVYARALVRKFTECPASAAKKAFNKMVSELKFLPSVGVVATELGKAEIELSTPAHIATLMDRERKRRLEIRQEEQRALEVAEFRKKVGNRTPMQALADEKIDMGKLKGKN